MKKALFRIAPWLITVIALYIAFRDIDWGTLFAHMRGISPWLLIGAVLTTIFSYLLRSYRWQFLFPSKVISFSNSVRVLVLGFFMNNILPARAGEFVRAHLGASVTGERRTLVLATIASERLADGITLSLMFVIFSFGIGDPRMAHNLLYVAAFFALATVIIALVLFNRARIFNLTDWAHRRINTAASLYTSERIKIFLNGLAPLYSRSRFPFLCFWSAVIWLVELAVYFQIERAFGASLSWPQTVLFLVAVNFSSLIPAAPAGVGVIEAVASAVLVSVGVEKEQALSMVIVQHVIQYLVVGIPGAVIMLSWKNRIRQIRDMEKSGAVDEQA